jgi:hypothetical protein
MEQEEIHHENKFEASVGLDSLLSAIDQTCWVS